MQLLKISSWIQLLRGGRAINGIACPIVTIPAKNGSGGTLVRGDVVVFDWVNSTTDLLVIKTSTGGNDVDVAGMVHSLSTGDGLVLDVQVFGPTKYLKVDGTTDIAVGDALGTFTTAKIAQKSTTGGRFAIALEAYATNDSSGVIDAFIRNLGCGAFTTE